MLLGNSRSALGTCHIKSEVHLAIGSKCTEVQVPVAARAGTGMPSQGKRMLAAAEQQLAAAARAAVADGESGLDEGVVELERAVAGVTRVPNWESLARQQAEIDEQVLQHACDGAAFALQDRNLLSMPWRQVFVVRDGDHFWVLDNKGREIDEPHDGVCAGRQLVETLVEEFNSDGLFYYKPGRVRRSPYRQRTQGCEDVTPVPMSSDLLSSKGVCALRAVRKLKVSST